MLNKVNKGFGQHFILKADFYQQSNRPTYTLNVYQRMYVDITSCWIKLMIYKYIKSTWYCCLN